MISLQTLLLLTLAQKPENFITVPEIKAQMYFLASDDMAGRDAGSLGGRIAANYIASEFARLGLKPVGDGQSYFQNLELMRYDLDAAAMGLAAKVNGVEKKFEYRKDFNWARQSGKNANVSGDLVFVGYGVNAPEYGYNDFAGMDLKGKILLVLNGEPQGNDPQSKFKGAWGTMHGYAHYKMEQLRKTGAAGVLLVTVGPPARLPRKASGPTNGGGGPENLISLNTSFWDIPAFSIRADVANQLLNGAKIEDLAREIDANGKPHSRVIAGVEVTMNKAVKNAQVVASRNVVGMLEGSDPTLTNEYVIVTAHYDHVGVLNGLIYRGADDNASGTIGVMQIARAFVEGKVRPKRSILFAVFEAEERGLLGAAYYVEHPIVPLAQTVANLNMDMIGRDEDSPTWNTTPEQNTNAVNIVGTLYNPGLRKVIEAKNRDIDLKLDYKTDGQDKEGWFARSDHFPFAVHSVPMVLFNTGENADYHTENDRPEKIDYTKMEKIVRLIFLTAEDLANRKDRIAFVR
jgi:putative aminopeptidase FrvX